MLLADELKLFIIFFINRTYLRKEKCFHSYIPFNFFLELLIIHIKKNTLCYNLYFIGKKSKRYVSFTNFV